MAASQGYPLFCIGNPLLDIQVTQGEALLKKYNLKENDAILAGAEHMPMCVDIGLLCKDKVLKFCVAMKRSSTSTRSPTSQEVQLKTPPAQQLYALFLSSYILLRTTNKITVCLARKFGRLLRLCWRR